ncbi:hypothetical protein MKW98_012650 [Papaver atlanticum]|uniref:Uncharacterized protein n=1 Tax=Papaver atlanticum TaxID=357466 RepID=A0AAD4XQI2_9MAGN|nr:hypothetical protein MKW98_012650 [Papaver atlanticum]
MKASTSISLCFLITLIFFLSSPTITILASSSPSTSSVLLQTGKTSVRKLGNHQQDKLNIKVMNTQSDIIKGVPAEADDNGEELVYHVDYHGVSTHPTPTPKHPRP